MGKVIKVIFIVLLLSLLTGCSDTCSKSKLESITSPNQEYTINSYRHNCGATVDYQVTAELCKNNLCLEIYKCYHEKDSYIYWLDNENVFINNKKLNIKKDSYNWKDDPNYYNKIYKKKIN